MNPLIDAASTANASHIESGASAPMSPTQKMTNLFNQIDPTGTGAITQDQFMQAFQTMNPPASFQAAGAAAVWNKLDPNGTGSVTKQDFVSTMTAMMKQLRGHHHHPGSVAGGQALAQGTSMLDALGNSSPTSNNSPAGSGGPGSLLNLLA
jgi:hypothetical protein